MCDIKVLHIVVTHQKNRCDKLENITYHQYKEITMSHYNSGGGYRSRGGSSSYQSQRDYRQYNNSSGNHYSSGGYGNYNKYNSNQYQSQVQQRKPYNRSNNYQANYPPRNNYQNSYDQGNHSAENQNQLWMGDLDPSWDENAIKKIWSAFGETPVAVKIIRDKFAVDSTDSKSNAGYCFVSFANQKAVSTAVLKNGLQIPGSTKVFKLNWASGSGSTIPQENNFKPIGKTHNDYSIFVGDLGSDVTEPMLFECFNKVYPNQVKQAKIMFDPVTKLSKGFGFVRFSTSFTQQKALNEMNGTIAGSRPIRVGMAAGSSNNAVGQDTFSKSETPVASNVHIAQPQPSLNAHTDPNNTTIIIKGLSSKFSEDELCSYFIAFGDIVYCKLSSDFNSGIIKYFLRSSAESALLFMHGSIANDCRIVVNWGKSDDAELSKINFMPNDSKSYTKASPAPLHYGSFTEHNIRFDKLTKEEALKIRLNILEESEPIPTDKLNEIYIRGKLHRDELLDSATF